ncbi:MAG: DUF6268 family outer membrane beta-barrel protein, partial [Puniceicoccales bacterium]|nr:DUF6268 family outer membrane beta-barrel protein [Puniceicoccales bacterium]
AAKAEEQFRYVRSVRLGAEWHSPASIKAARGELSATCMETEFSTIVMDSSNLFVGSLEYRYTDYRFHNTTAPLFADAEFVGVRLIYERKLTQNWAILADAVGSFSAEVDARLHDGAAGGFGGGVRYAFNDDLKFFAGTHVFTRLSRGAQVVPIGGIIWKIDPHWSLFTTNGVTLVYDVFADESWRLDLSCSYEGANIRLADGGKRKRVLEVREVPLTFRVTRNFGQAAYIRASIGGVLYGRYKFRSGSATTGDFEAGPALQLGLVAGMRF